MSKNRLYGYNKWYELNGEDKYKTSNVKRKYENEYKLKVTLNNTDIKTSDFIKKMVRNFDDDIKKENSFIRNYPECHFLFKVKEINDYKIVHWKYENKGKDQEITRKKLEKEINVSGNSFLYKEIEFYLYNNLEEYKDCSHKNKIFYKDQVNYREEIEILNTKLKEVNKILYQVLKETSTQFKNKQKLREYNWEEFVKNFIREKLEEENIDKKFNLIKEMIQKNNNLLSNVLYREKKRINDMFFEISYYLKLYFQGEAKFDIENIVDYLFNISRQYLNFGFKHKINDKNMKQIEKTYIKSDQHTNNRISEKENNLKYKMLLKIKDNKDYIDLEFEKKYILLFTKKLEEIIKEYESNRNKGLIGEFKKYYLDIFSSKCEKYSDEEKFILSNIYSYIKGRIKKYLKNPKMKYEDVFRKELKENCKENINQKLLEYILYHGKIQHNNLEENINSFQKYHAYEELLLETLLAISNLSFQLLSVRKNDANNEFEDLFGEKITLDKLKKIDNSSVNLSESTKNILEGYEDKNFKFTYIDKEEETFNNDFINDFNLIYELRSKIIHGINPFSIIEGNNEFDNLTPKYNINKNLDSYLTYRLEDATQKHTVSLNLKKNLNVCQKKIFSSINIYENKINNNYVPSSSKVVNNYKDLIIIGDNIDKEEELKNVGKYLVKLIYTNEVGYANSEFYNRYKIKFTNKDSKNDQSGYDILKKKYEIACSKEAKGKKGSVKKFHRDVIEVFQELFNEKYLDLLNFSILDSNNDDVKLPKEDIYSKLKNENKIVQTYTIIGLFVDNKILNLLINRVLSTKNWIESLNFGFEHIDIEKQILEEIYNNLCTINEISKYNFEFEFKSIKNKLDNKEKYNRYNEQMKIYEKIGSIKLSDDFLKNIAFEQKDKKLLEILKNYNIENFKDKTIDDLKDDIIDGEQKGTFIMELKALLKHETFEVLVYGKYVENMEKFKQNEYFENLKQDVFFKTDGKTPIFRKDLYKYFLIDDKFRNIISENIVKDKFTFNDNEKKLYLEKKEIEDKILKVNNVLTEINLNTKTLKNTKIITESIKNNFKAYFKNYNDYKEFLEEYNTICSYRKIGTKLYFKNHLYANEKMYEINWNYIKFILRYERDLHYFINGLDRLDLCQIKLENNSASSPEKKYDQDDELKYFRKYFKLSKITSKGKENIRNYIAHYYLIREPYKKSVINIGKDLEELMDYRKKYQSGVRNSTLYLFKNDVNLKYDEIRRYYEFDNIATKIERKKVSKLQLKYWNDSIIEIIKRILEFEC